MDSKKCGYRKKGIRQKGGLDLLWIQSKVDSVIWGFILEWIQLFVDNTKWGFDFLWIHLEVDSMIWGFTLEMIPSFVDSHFWIRKVGIREKWILSDSH